MIYPSLDDLLKNVDNKFTLVIVASKRARRIIQEEHQNDERPAKAVTIAFEEIVNGKTSFQSSKTGIK